MREINSGEGDKIGERGYSRRMKKKGKIGGKNFTREEDYLREINKTTITNP